MRQHLFRTILALFAFQLFVNAAPQAKAGDSWMFRPSYFTHSPITGERVNQYRQEDPAIAIVDPTYQESGFNYQQYDLNIGGTQSHLHVVQTWGQGTLIRPYGEWEYPYRPGATPYGPWLNPRGPWSQPNYPWSNLYGSGRPDWGRGQPTPYGYGAGQNTPMPMGAMPNGAMSNGMMMGGAPFGGGPFPPPQSGLPQSTNPIGQGNPGPKVQGPVAF